MDLSDRRYPPFSERFTFEAGSVAHDVFLQSSAGKAGPPVMIMHELPGMTAEFWRFCHWMRSAGFSVYAPDLFGKPGAMAPPLGPLRGFARACIAREIHLFAHNSSGPITQWLRALSRELFARHGGEGGTAGVGVIGMCMTGNFALSLVVEDCVNAPVASQPAMPMGLSKKARTTLRLTEEEEAALRRRTDVPVMALRFDGDPSCKNRFETIEALVGERLRSHIIPDSAQNKKTGNPIAHSVLTKDLIDEDGEPTKEAANAVIAFMKERLRP